MPPRRSKFLSDDDEFYTGVSTRSNPKENLNSRNEAQKGSLGVLKNWKAESRFKDEEYPQENDKDLGQKHYNHHTPKHHKPPPPARFLHQLASSELTKIKESYDGILKDELREARSLLKTIDTRDDEKKEDPVMIPEEMVKRIVEESKRISGHIRQVRIVYVNMKKKQNDRPEITEEEIRLPTLDEPKGGVQPSYDVKTGKNYLHYVIKKILALYYHKIKFTTHVGTEDTEYETHTRKPAEVRFYNEYTKVLKAKRYAKQESKKHHSNHHSSGKDNKSNGRKGGRRHGKNTKQKDES